MRHPLLVLCPIRLCLSGVGCLRRLIATTKHNERCYTALGIVHAVPRAIVNPELPHTAANDINIAKIAETHARQTGADSCLSLNVTQSTKPFLEWHSSCTSDVHFNGL